MKGNNGCALFEAPFAINTKTNTVTLFELQSDTTKSCGNSSKDEFLKYFDNSTYPFEITDQTLNILQNNKVIMKFDLAKKNSL